MNTIVYSNHEFIDLDFSKINSPSRQANVDKVAGCDEGILFHQEIY